MIESSFYCNWVGDAIECVYKLELWSLHGLYHRSGWMQLVGSLGFLILSSQ